MATSGCSGDQLGLALLVEHHLHQQPGNEKMLASLDSAAETAWQMGQLDRLTTSELLARLHQRSGPWMLGLLRGAEEKAGPALGTFHRGDPLVCAGLASRLKWIIARDSTRQRLNNPDFSSDPGVLAQELLGIINDTIDRGTPAVGFTAGLTCLLEHGLRASMETRQ
jgi:hypothetical protein